MFAFLRLGRISEEQNMSIFIKYTARAYCNVCKVRERWYSLERRDEKCKVRPPHGILQILVNRRETPLQYSVSLCYTTHSLHQWKWHPFKLEECLILLFCCTWCIIFILTRTVRTGGQGPISWWLSTDDLHTFVVQTMYDVKWANEDGKVGIHWKLPTGAAALTVMLWPERRRLVVWQARVQFSVRPPQRGFTYWVTSDEWLYCVNGCDWMSGFMY